MNNRLYNIEFGTFLIKKNKITLPIAKQLFSVESIEELNRTVQKTEQNELFLPIEKIDEYNSSYIFTYQVDFGILRNLKTIKQESLSVRLSIAKSIMKQDILNSYNGYVSIYPANIWYYPMRTVKYAYHGSYDMPSTEKESKIVRYKALMLYILIGYPYEKALKKEYRLDEKKNPFAVQIINTESIEQLAQLIEEEEDIILSHDMESRKIKKNILKIGAGVAAILLFFTNLTTFMSTRHALEASADAEITMQLQAAQNEIDTLKINEQINESINKKEFESAGKLMEEIGTDNQEIADFMFEQNQYDLALLYNPDILEKVVQYLYEQENEETILELKLEDEINGELVKKLSLEQAIVAYNTEKIDSQWVFIEDKYTLLRAAVAYINNHNLQPAKDICSKLENYEYKQEADYVNALVVKTETNTSLKEAEKSLEEAKALPDEDENKANRIREAENSVNSFMEKLNTAEENITSTQEILKEMWKNEITNN